MNAESVTRALLSTLRCLVGAVVGLAIVLVPPAHAEAPSAPEYALKAIFLARLGSFVTWPNVATELPAVAAGGTFDICILGSDPFGPSIDVFAGRLVGARPTAIRRIEKLLDSSGCSVLYLPRGAGQLADLARVRDWACCRPILTVGDGPSFASAGGVIGFVLDDERIRLEVNVRAAELAGLEISSDLLRIVTVVDSTVTCAGPLCLPSREDVYPPQASN